MTHTKLAERRCVPCEGGIAPLTASEAAEFMSRLGKHWTLSEDGRKITGHFEFKNYFRTLSFVNAAAYTAVDKAEAEEAAAESDATAVTVRL